MRPCCVNLMLDTDGRLRFACCRHFEVIPTLAHRGLRAAAAAATAHLTAVTARVGCFGMLRGRTTAALSHICLIATHTWQHATILVSAQRQGCPATSI